MSTVPALSSLQDGIRYFADPDRCLETAVALHWPNGVVCPTCRSTEVSFLKTRRLWKCRTKHTRQQFSVKTGSIFEDSPIPFDKWFTAIWLLANCKKGISSYELARDLGVTQKTGWFMLQRIRFAIQSGSFENVRRN
jgi:transposase-like protein